LVTKKKIKAIPIGACAFSIAATEEAAHCGTF
jgi:hypothetical protein